MPDRARVSRPGTVYLVGAGPGDPGLLTVRGRALLADCDVVVYDALANPELLSAHRASGRPAAALLFVGKRGGDEGSTRQDHVNATLVRLAREGKAVVRLKGGDPFVFGRGGEEAQALTAAAVPFEVVPGVSAAIAVPAYAGVPGTQRGVASSFAVITGHEDPSKPASSHDWDALVRVDTLVCLMGVDSLPAMKSGSSRRARW